MRLRVGTNTFSQAGVTRTDTAFGYIAAREGSNVGRMCLLLARDLVGEGFCVAPVPVYAPKVTRSAVRAPHFW